jgi:hypothetical protein
MHAEEIASPPQPDDPSASLAQLNATLERAKKLYLWGHKDER